MYKSTPWNSGCPILLGTQFREKGLECILFGSGECEEQQSSLEGQEGGSWRRFEANGILWGEAGERDWPS